MSNQKMRKKENILFILLKNYNQKVFLHVQVRHIGRVHRHRKDRNRFPRSQNVNSQSRINLRNQLFVQPCEIQYECVGIFILYPIIKKK